MKKNYSSPLTNVTELKEQPELLGDSGQGTGESGGNERGAKPSDFDDQEEEPAVWGE